MAHPSKAERALVNGHRSADAYCHLASIPHVKKGLRPEPSRRPFGRPQAAGL